MAAAIAPHLWVQGVQPPYQLDADWTLWLQAGALDGGSPISRVEFKEWSCRMSLSYSCPMSPLRCCHVACLIYRPYAVALFFLVMSISPIWHVGFKKWPCRRVAFRGQGPSGSEYAGAGERRMTGTPYFRPRCVMRGSVIIINN